MICCASDTFQRIEIGLILSFITFLTLRLLTPLAENENDSSDAETDSKN
ncbi:MAG: hypothetical protein LH614_15725 [Pyrinomonadaceae bacterium]|nr:hypothetical protein [Pyrinomonadaceae bacterium]